MQTEWHPNYILLRTHDSKSLLCQQISQHVSFSSTQLYNVDIGKLWFRVWVDRKMVLFYNYQRFLYRNWLNGRWWNLSWDSWCCDQQFVHVCLSQTKPTGLRQEVECLPGQLSLIFICLHSGSWMSSWQRSLNIWIIGEYIFCSHILDLKHLFITVK